MKLRNSKNEHIISSEKKPIFCIFVAINDDWTALQCCFIGFYFNL